MPAFGLYETVFFREFGYKGGARGFSGSFSVDGWGRQGTTDTGTGILCGDDSECNGTRETKKERTLVFIP